MISLLFSEWWGWHFTCTIGRSEWLLLVWEFDLQKDKEKISGNISPFKPGFHNQKLLYPDLSFVFTAPEPLPRSLDIFCMWNKGTNWV